MPGWEWEEIKKSIKHLWYTELKTARRISSGALGIATTIGIIHYSHSIFVEAKQKAKDAEIASIIITQEDKVKYSNILPEQASEEHIKKIKYEVYLVEKEIKCKQVSEQVTRQYFGDDYDL